MPGLNNLKGLIEVFKWKAQGTKIEWPKTLNDTVATQAGKPLAPETARITYINHATILIELPGFTAITDPIFSERASPLSWAGPKRSRPPGVLLSQIPRIDAVLVSHNHYDHLDIPSLTEIQTRHQPIFVTPLGNSPLLAKAGAQKIFELDWWQEHVCDSGAVITAVPAQHWSRRGAFDTNHSLWSGFVIHHLGRRIYFSGDTGYADHFLETQQRIGDMDIALLPIGAYEPRWFMKTHHMNPTDSVQAHLDLGAKQSVAMHFGTFQLTDEAIGQPEIDLEKALVEKKLDPRVFRAPRHGESIEVAFGAP